ncbi:MAG TPA: glycosyltransferase family A protein [Candidatus Acidoferrales bacterium]|nr:glycosyltransferase family A protein [Candidatus Acidoferrales bacterium]
MSYWAAVVTRNGATHLTQTLDSLLNQREAPERITIVDDGSTDDTASILSRYARLNNNVIILTKPNRGYDIRRVPANINQAWAKNTDLTTDYFMISGDDCIYPVDYAARLLAKMQSDARLVVASGRPTSGGTQSLEHSPSGSGRMVRSSFWSVVGGAYPSSAGWETWLLYKAQEQGLRIKLFNDLSYAHARPRGAGHQFVYWGAAMGTLGYHPLYAIGRIARNALVRSIGIVGAIKMTRGYLQSRLGSNDPFIHPFDKRLREFVECEQRLRIQEIVAGVLRKIFR